MYEKGLGGVERHHARGHSPPANYFHPGNLLADRYGVTNPPPAAPSASLPKS